jgi:hypothetical protein
MKTKARHSGHTCEPSSQEAKAGGSQISWIQGQPKSHSKKPCSKKERKRKKPKTLSFYV